MKIELTNIFSPRLVPPATPLSINPHQPKTLRFYLQLSVTNFGDIGKTDGEIEARFPANNVNGGTDFCLKHKTKTKIAAEAAGKPVTLLTAV